MDDLKNYEAIAISKFLSLTNEGFQCGTASLIALAEAFEIPLCYEIKSQSKMFTCGGFVGDRCAVFQSLLVLIGLKLGRTSPDVNRGRYRDIAIMSARCFNEKFGGYRCCLFP